MRLPHRLENLPMVNRVSAAQTISLKRRLTDANGTPPSSSGRRPAATPNALSGEGTFVI
jgi:hypothetical protein